MIKDLIKVFDNYGEFVYRNQEPRFEMKITGKWTKNFFYPDDFFEKSEVTDLTNYSEKDLERILSIAKRWKEIYTLNPTVVNWGEYRTDAYWLTQADYDWFIGFVPWSAEEIEPDFITDISFTYSVGSIISDFKFKEEVKNNE